MKRPVLAANRRKCPEIWATRCWTPSPKGEKIEEKILPRAVRVRNRAVAIGSGKGEWKRTRSSVNGEVSSPVSAVDYKLAHVGQLPANFVVIER